MAHCTRHHPHAERVHIRRRAEQAEDERMAIFALVFFLMAFLFAGTLDYQDRVGGSQGHTTAVEATSW